MAKRALCLIALALALACCGCSASPDSSATAAAVQLSAAVGSTSATVTIKNNDSFDWTNVRVELNPVASVAGVSSFHGQTPAIPAGKSQTFRLSDFARPNGIRYNPTVDHLKEIVVNCATSKGSGQADALVKD